jgi:hypothetical protein
LVKNENIYKKQATTSELKNFLDDEINKTQTEVKKPENELKFLIK